MDQAFTAKLLIAQLDQNRLMQISFLDTFQLDDEELEAPWRASPSLLLLPSFV
jgi:hypothetical protein